MTVGEVQGCPHLVSCGCPEYTINTWGSVTFAFRDDSYRDQFRGLGMCQQIIETFDQIPVFFLRCLCNPDL